MADFASIWRETAVLNGLDAFAGDGRFTRLYELLTEANAKMNLTAIRDGYGTAVLHFADSLTAAEHIPEGACVIDVGCGGGFPSLPLAIARPDISVTALDSTAKKLSFVESAARELGLDNLTAVCGRAEEIGCDPLYRERFDAATARAVAPLDILCELCLPLVRVGGLFIAMKSQAADGELEDASDVVEKLGAVQADRRDLTLKFPAGAERTDDDPARSIIIFRKVAPTPGEFPRHYSQIKKSHEKRVKRK